MTGFMLTILISAITALIVSTILTLYEPARDRVELLWERLIWKYTIPEGFKGKNKLIEIAKRDIKIKISNEIYRKLGLIEYNFGGVKYFVFQIKPEKDIDTRWGVRWLGFEDERICLWAELTDDKFWEIINKPKLDMPETISIEYVKESLRKGLEPSIKLGNQEIRIDEVKHGKISILSGKYALWQAECDRIKFRVSESICLCCTYYGSELCYNDKYIGKEIEESEIELFE